jgi:hypothetical protein
VVSLSQESPCVHAGECQHRDSPSRGYGLVMASTLPILNGREVVRVFESLALPS